ncbi:hypothetical protein D3C77_505470 [compost metagenome]
MDVGQLAGGFGGDVHACRSLTHQAIFAGGLEWRFAADAQANVLAGDQLGKTQLAAIGVAEYAPIQAQLRRVDLPLLGGQTAQMLARFSRSIAQGDGRDLDGRAGDGRALIGCALGVAEHHVHLLHVQVQFFGNNLRQRGTYAGSQVDVTIKGVDPIGGGDGDKQAQFLGLEFGAGALGHRAGRWLDVVHH